MTYPRLQKPPKASVVRLTATDKLFYVIVDVFLVVLFIIIAIPLWSTITLSFRPNHFVGTNFEGMFLVPWKWSTAAYEALLGNNGFISAFWNSIKIMVFGVASALLLTIPLAYGLSVKTLPGRAIIVVIVLIPHMFDVGMIPSFLMVKDLGLIDKLAAVYLPSAVTTYNCLIMKGFFEGIPDELKESARIDGASELYLLMKIIIPLSKPIIMSVGLFYAVSFWNDFFHPMLYLNSNHLMPLPILLRNILMASGMNEFVEVSAFGEAPIQAIKAASVFLAAIPMILAYPFIQKYFAKGTLLGSVKG
jgi:putative aldouronate transport system permease protein